MSHRFLIAERVEDRRQIHVLVGPELETADVLKRIANGLQCAIRFIADAPLPAELEEQLLAAENTDEFERSRDMILDAFTAGQRFERGQMFEFGSSNN